MTQAVTILDKTYRELCAAIIRRAAQSGDSETDSMLAMVDQARHRLHTAVTHGAVASPIPETEAEP